jgi:hypothetical protein
VVTVGGVLGVPTGAPGVVAVVGPEPPDVLLPGAPLPLDGAVPDARPGA